MVRPTSASLPARRPQVPSDFGAENGTPISNLSTILGDVDRALGRKRPPALEVIFVEPVSLRRLTRNQGTGTNPFGHVLLRYTTPSGEQVAVNVTGKPGLPLLGRFAPEDYFFGTENFDEGNTQRGVYNWRMIGVSVDEVPAEQLAALHDYFLQLEEREKRGTAGYTLAAPGLVNFVNKLLPGDQPEVGNCAYWPSRALVHAGLLPADKATEWPKELTLDFFETHERANPGSTHVVNYERIKHSAAKNSGVDARGPLSWWPSDVPRSVRYWDMGKLADVSVRVPEGSMEAAVFED